LNVEAFLYPLSLFNPSRKSLDFRPLPLKGIGRAILMDSPRDESSPCIQGLDECSFEISAQEGASDFSPWSST